MEDPKRPLMGAMPATSGSPDGEGRERPWARRLGQLLPAACAVTAATSGVVLLGWGFDVAILKSGLPGLTEQKANTAVGLMLASLSLWGLHAGLRHSLVRIGSAAGGGIVLIQGSLALFEHVTGADVGINELLVRDVTTLPGDVPGQMALVTAVGFVLLGTALVLLTRPTQIRLVVSQVLIAALALIVTPTLIGPVYDADRLNRAQLGYTPIALLTAVQLLLLSVAILVGHTGSYLRRTLGSNGPDGISTRRLLPVAFGCPILIGGILMWGNEWGLIAGAADLALFATATMAVVSGLLLWNASTLQAADAQRSRTEAALRESDARLRAVLENSPVALFTQDREVRYTWAFNSRAGFDSSEIVGKLDTDLLPGDDGDRMTSLKRRVLDSSAGAHEEVSLSVHGGRRHFDMTVQPLRDATAAVVGVTTVAVDVTDRHVAEEAIRQIDRRLRVISENTLDLVSEVTLDGTYLYVSPSFGPVLGYDPNELIGTSAFDLVHPDDLAHARRLVAEAMAERQQVRFECRCRHGDGRYFWIDMTGQLLFDAAGTPSGAILSGRDMTARRQAVASLRESEERFRRFANATNDAIWDWQLETDQLWWNEGLTALFGYSRDEVGATIAAWSSRIAPEDRQRVVTGLRKFIERGDERWSDEYHFVRKDGTVAYVLERGYVVRDGGGNPVRIIAGMRDMTERRAVEQKLTEQAALLDKARDAIFARDLNDCVTYWNAGAERLYGWTSAEAIGRKCEDLLGRDPTDLVPDRAEVLERGEWKGQIQKTTKHGATLTLDSSRTLLRDAEGRPKSILTIDTDITERRLLEEQFRQAQKMEAVGQLAGGVAHDFNNVLTAIMGFGELVGESLGPESPLQSDVDEILKAARRAADLTRQLLAFSRRQVLQPQILNLGAVVAGMERMTRRVIGENIEMVTRIPAILGTVNADRGQLEQVLMNLIVNARDAMPQGGTITVAVRNATLVPSFVAMHPGAKVGPHVVLEVRDTGVGMNAAVRARIFEPFFTTKERGKGTGLGLATVYGIVQQSEGFMTVESEPGRGTRFDIYLPEALAQAEEVPNASSTPTTGAGTETILVVEDQAEVRVIVQKILGARGYTVISAQDGERALAVLANHTSAVDLMITDLIMPRMNGRELGRQVAARYPRVRILYMSGYADNAVPLVIEPGEAFLAKPFTPSALVTAIRNLLDGRTRDKQAARAAS